MIDNITYHKYQRPQRARYEGSGPGHEDRSKLKPRISDLSFVVERAFTDQTAVHRIDLRPAIFQGGWLYVDVQ